jgi:hypothetical protein
MELIFIVPTWYLMFPIVIVRLTINWEWMFSTSASSGVGGWMIFDEPGLGVSRFSQWISGGNSDSTLQDKEPACPASTHVWNGGKSGCNSGRRGTWRSAINKIKIQEIKKESFFFIFPKSWSAKRVQHFLVRWLPCISIQNLFFFLISNSSQEFFMTDLAIEKIQRSKPSTFWLRNLQGF